MHAGRAFGGAFATSQVQSWPRPPASPHASAFASVWVHLPSAIAAGAAGAVVRLAVVEEEEGEASDGAPHAPSIAAPTRTGRRERSVFMACPRATDIPL